jgi:hypothetical protein
MNEAWPKVLARLTGKNVYNLAMSGYGPNQLPPASDEGVRFETGNDYLRLV